MRVWDYSGAWDDARAAWSRAAGSVAHDRPGAEYLHLELALLAALRGQTGHGARASRRHGLVAAERGQRARWTYAACEADDRGSRPANSRRALDLLSATMRRDRRDRRTFEPGEPDRFPARDRCRVRPRAAGEAAESAVAAGRPATRSRPALPAGAARPRRRPARRRRADDSRPPRRNSALRSKSSPRWLSVLARERPDRSGGRAHRRPPPRRSQVLLDEAIRFSRTSARRRRSSAPRACWPVCQ